MLNKSMIQQPILTHDVDGKYHQQLNDILENGSDKDDRTGVGSRSVFGRQHRFSLANYAMPIITTKKVFTRGALHELIWMISGKTNIGYLKANDVNIWDSWIDQTTAIYNPLTFKERLQLFLSNDADKSKLAIVSKLLYGILPPESEELKDSLVLNKTVRLTWPLEQQPKLKEMLDQHAVPTDKLIDGDLPEIYQKQWRHWEDVRIIDAKALEEHYGRGYLLVSMIEGDKKAVVRREIDQLKNVIEQLRNNPDSRRIIVSAWNPAVIDTVALPPCHAFFQFFSETMTVGERTLWMARNKPAVMEHIHLNYTEAETMAVFDKCNIPKRKLSCQLYQRSADIVLGVPLNIIFYSALTHMVAQCVGMVAEEFIWTGGDVHVYNNQFEGIVTQLKRESVECFPQIELNPQIKEIDDFTFNDISIVNYESQDAIKFPRAAV